MYDNFEKVNLFAINPISSGIRIEFLAVVSVYKVSR